MIIAVASGKGGTGKTTIATNLALSLQNVRFLDCDVEEPNAHLFLNPELTEKDDINVIVPDIDETKCNYCGDCRKICNYKALFIAKDRVIFFKQLCHSCLGCYFVCKQNAITKGKKSIGVIEKGYYKNTHNQKSEFLHGKLNIGEAMAVPLIKALNARINKNSSTIIDAPPGTSCPVVETIKNSGFCLLVTEPTPFGLHDLKLMVETVKELNKKAGLVINRSTLGNKDVWDYARSENIPVLMEIPMDKNIAMAYSKGIPLVHAIPEYIPKFQDLFNRINSYSVGEK